MGQRIAIIAGCLVVMALSLLMISYKYPQHLLSFKHSPPASIPIEAPRETFTVPVDPNETLHIGIFGESRGDEDTGEAFNQVVVSHLFQILKKKGVQAVFATGDLVTGSTANKPQDKWILQEQLKDFVQLYQSILGQTPLFPTMGSFELAASEDSKIFREAFKLNTKESFGRGAFAYTVSIGKAFFAVIPTDQYDTLRKTTSIAFNPKMLDWLDKELKKAAHDHAFLFVVGHEPAYVTSVTFQNREETQNDEFWRVLVDNNVLAYFSSRERLFDRSNRRGVWQIISGGGGAPLKEGSKDKSFFHCLLLNIPSEANKVPLIEVYNEQGELYDEFELAPNKSVLYQFRISRNSVAVKKPF